MSEEKKSPAKKETVITKIEMDDGRVVGFAGKRRMLKESMIDNEEGSVTTRFDFVNGQTRSFTVSLGDPLALQLLGHGIEQKVGDETAGDENVEDMVLHVDSVLERLGKGEWSSRRASGESFAGAHVVVKAIAEATGKDIPWVKAWLEAKLEAGKEAGLSRQKLYASFKAPGTKTAPIIARLEAEKTAKDSGLDANDLLGEVMEGGEGEE